MTYQLGFSASHPEQMYDEQARRAKANKSLTILTDYLHDLSALSLLDIGCSTGFMTRIYAERFRSVVALDIDEPAVNFAARENQAPNIEFRVGDSMATGLPSDSFDVVTCTHIYEHVPDAQRLVDEIYRVLKPGGVCMFAAGNRFIPIEGHYGLPLLAAIPKPLGHLYLRAARKGDHYYETHFSHRNLRKLVARFEVIDYTRRVIEHPQRYSATDVVPPDSTKQKVARVIAAHANWLVPTYLWLLKKPAADQD